MGTWGMKTFENDEASDWAIDLEATEDATLLKASLNPAEVKGCYLEAPDCVRILCAGEVIAGIAGQPRPSLPDNVASWITSHKDLNVTELVPVAIAKVRRVMDQHSELDKLWAENKEDYPKWKEDVTGLCDLLKALPPKPPAPKHPWWKLW